VTPAVGALADVRSLRQCDGGFSVFVRQELALRLVQLAADGQLLLTTATGQLLVWILERLAAAFKPAAGRSGDQRVLRSATADSWGRLKCRWPLEWSQELHCSYSAHGCQTALRAGGFALTTAAAPSPPPAAHGFTCSTAAASCCWSAGSGAAVSSCASSWMARRHPAVPGWWASQYQQQMLRHLDLLLFWWPCTFKTPSHSRLSLRLRMLKHGCCREKAAIMRRARRRRLSRSHTCRRRSCGSSGRRCRRATSSGCRKWRWRHS